MHILLPSDVFPPGSVGGAAWSAHTLARALIERGHTVTAIVPTQGQSNHIWADVRGVPTLRWGYRAPRLPFVQNYFRHERLWQPLAHVLVGLAQALTDGQKMSPGHPVTRSPGHPVIPSALLIHAQHVQTIPAAVMAGRRLGVPVMVTVRDHWPWDYFATGLHGDRLPYPQPTWASLATDLPARLGPLPGALALPAIPYMLAHARRRAALLAQADAVIAVSAYIARRLARSVPAERLHIIPNMVDIARTERIAAVPPATVLAEPFLLFVGKLEWNKGAGLLGEIFRVLAGQLPHAERHALPALVIAGSGSLRTTLARTLADLGVRTHFLDWAAHDEVLRLMARCDMLLFPSAWGEPLSRVLLEASALGVPILAMPTGGTPDIIADDINGALAATPEQFAQRMLSLLRNPAERSRLGDEARRTARQRFAVEAVISQVEDLYAALLAMKRAT